MSTTPVQTVTKADAATRLQNFAQMSAALTGFRAEVIAPEYDPTDLKALYLKTADQESGAATVDALLAQYVALKDKPKQQIADTLLDVANANPAPPAKLARTLALLWYLGVWYSANGNGRVISANAYIGGLAWKAAQAHAMGYSEFMFGYWNQPPAPLASFGVDMNEGESNGKSQ